MARPAVPLSPRGTLAERLGKPATALPFPQELLGQARENDVPQSALYLAWELALMASELSRQEQESLAVLILASFLEVRRGSTALPLESGPRMPLSSLLNRLKVEPELKERVERFDRSLTVTGGTSRAAPVTGESGSASALVIQDGLLYHHRLWSSEHRVGQAVSRRLVSAGRDEAAIEKAVAEIIEAPPVFASGAAQLSPEQLEALRVASRMKLALVSGGPGTGKTFIVLSLLRVLIRLGISPRSIAVAAPTGKAANRLEASMLAALGAISDPSEAGQKLRDELPAPQTLHRLLSFSPSAGRFLHHENNRLREQVVIVDEASMVGLELMDQLLRSLKEEATLVLLGDADQLPSVDAGAVFRDLTNASPSAVRLTESYRVSPGSAQLLQVAQAIRKGAVEPLFEGRRGIDPLVSAGERGGPVALLPLAGDGVFESRLSEWYSRVFDSDSGVRRLASATYRKGPEFDLEEIQMIEKLFRHLERSRLLCVTRGPALRTGAEPVNGFLHSKRFEELSRGGASWRSVPDFLPGEPVMMERNDYGMGLFNGDQGVVLRVGEEGGGARLMAVFLKNGKVPEAFPIEILRADLTLAYALTVHKSQGSEFDETVLILPDEPIPLLTRELIYTALTRSRRRAEFWGSVEVLRRGVEQPSRRFTNLLTGERESTP
jgi:exodeoxyribonuclease V alpha subunit